MSKHPSNETKRNLLRRGLAGILLLAMLFGLLPSGVFTAHAASWADPYVETLVGWGVMRGDIGGNMAPDRSITRAEFVTMMNRAYGYTKTGGHPFTDVQPADWYSDDVDIAYNIGYFKGTSPNTASPNATLTREQAAVLLARNMMLQETVGEAMGFSDSRSLSDWSRGLVGAAAANGIISGYDDGTFQPFRNITRGEVAAMLVRAIGTPINTEGEHALGNVYGNVTVNTSGVKLRDGVIVGNLYLTGGIDLGDVLLENVTVLGEIVVSGGGESNSSASSIVMRNVEADNMIVDSISDQFVTIRAEGVTDIPTTTVRTNAYVDDSSLPGYGLSYIELDGGEGTLLQVAGNVKEVWNRTPGSNLQVVQGSADKITVDEKATGSTVLVDGDAQVGDLNLDVATTVTGAGDIKNLNVGAAGSTVEQLPDKITIRPGITSSIAGNTMNSSQAAESSSDPRLLAGYPKVKNIAPTSATLVFRTNKPGTIYWAVSAVSDGSVSEENLLEPPVYGGNVLKSGTINATAANTDYTAAVTGLTRDGSYYVTAMLVDGRDQHSPIKVTSFSTPDDTVPAFNQGYPYMSRITTENSQVTVSTNKSCLLYYALLPAGSTAPTPAEFKANAVSGNLGFGTIDAVKNVTQPFQVNSTRLKELTDYTLYLWLTDYDGAKSSAVVAVNFKTPDEQPPVIVEREQSNATANSADVTFKLNEAGTLFWAVVPEGVRDESGFEGIDEEDWNADEVNDPEDRRLQIKIENKAGIASGSTRVNAGYVDAIARITGLDPAKYGHSFTMYLVAKDAAGNYSKIQKIHIKTSDVDPPTVKLQFSPSNEDKPMDPPVNTDARLLFSERVLGQNKSDDFLELYRKVDAARNDPAAQAEAKNNLAAALFKYIKLHPGTLCNNSTAANHKSVEYATLCQYVGTANGGDENGFVYGITRDSNEDVVPKTDWVINYCNAIVEEPDKDGNMVIVFPTDRTNATKPNSALNLNSGTTYHFVVSDVVDTAESIGSSQGPNALRPNGTYLGPFTTQASRVLLNKGKTPTLKYLRNPNGAPTAVAVTNQNNREDRIDYIFTVNPQDVEKEGPGKYWDMLFWFNYNVGFTLYSRPINDELPEPQPIDESTGAPYADPDDAPWTYEGTMFVGKDRFESFMANIPTKSSDPAYEQVKNMLNLANGAGEEDANGKTRKEQREYAIHIDSLQGNDNYTTWSREQVELQVSVVTGDRIQLRALAAGGTKTTYEEAVRAGVKAIGEPDPYIKGNKYTDQTQPEITTVPTIKVGSETATVTVNLNPGGSVYYLAIALDELYDSSGKGIEDNVELVESLVYGVSSYRPALQVSKDEKNTVKIKLSEIPLMQGDPDRNSTNSPATGPSAMGYVHKEQGVKPAERPTFSEFNDDDLKNIDGVIQGHTNATRNSVIPHVFTLDVKPNTVYLLFLTAAGVDKQPDENSKIVCYRFTTDMEEIPKITLSGTNNPTIVATETTNKPAIIDYVLINYEAAINDSGLSAKFKDVVADADVFASYTPQDSKLKDVPKDEITVWQAMADYHYSGTTFKGTAFDLYAKEENKNDYVRLVRSMSDSQGGDDYVLTGQQGTRPVTTLTMPFGNDIGVRKDDYIVVAMARRQDSDHYAFCAWYKVHGKTVNGPVITGSMPYYEPTEESGDNPDPNKTTISGTLTLVFDKYLYRYVGSNNYVAYDSCGPTKHASGAGTSGSTAEDSSGKKYYALGDAATQGKSTTVVLLGDETSHTQPTRSITLEINALKVGSSGGILFDKWGSFVDEDGNPGRITVRGEQVERSPLSITVKAVNAGTREEPDYKLEVTVNDGWTQNGWDSGLR